MNSVILKRFDAPDELRSFEKGTFALVHLGGINGKQHRTGLREVDEHRLMAGDMSARLDEFEAGKQLRIATNELVA